MNSTLDPKASQFQISITELHPKVTDYVPVFKYIYLNLQKYKRP